MAKTGVSRLGSHDYGLGQSSTDGVLRIVSASTVYPLKRVHLIYESLLEIKEQEIQWTHFGDGEDFDDLIKYVNEHRQKNISVDLRGMTPHEELMKYYMNTPVDLFINVSTNEGVPVSIMEAISFDIPVVATDVGASGEVVNEQAGVLVNSNPRPSDVAKAIMAVYKSKKKYNPRVFWAKNYNAEKNYYIFALSLLSL